MHKLSDSTEPWILIEAGQPRKQALEDIGAVPVLRRRVDRTELVLWRRKR